MVVAVPPVLAGCARFSNHVDVVPLVTKFVLVDTVGCKWLMLPPAKMDWLDVGSYMEINWAWASISISI